MIEERKWLYKGRTDSNSPSGPNEVVVVGIRHL